MRFIKRLLPERADNACPGNGLAPGFFALVLGLKIYVGLGSLLNGRAMARAGDGIALDGFTAGSSQAVVSLYALWGLEHLAICVLGLVVLIRYRALIPLMFALFLLEHLGRKLVLHFTPLAAPGMGGESAGLSPTPYGFLILIVVGLVLSLMGRGGGGERK